VLDKFVGERQLLEEAITGCRVQVLDNIFGLRVLQIESTSVTRSFNSSQIRALDISMLAWTTCLIGSETE
jgi:hypothetical protein